VDLWRITKGKTHTASALTVWSSSTDYAKSIDTVAKNAGTFIVGDDFEFHVLKCCTKCGGTCEM
jgi:hypothetical protein